MRPITCKLSSDISTLYTTGRASITSLTTGLLDIPQYTIGTMSSGQNTQYIQYIYKYIGLQLDFQKWYYLLYLPNELKRIFGFVTKACFFRWNQKLIFSRSLVRALLPYYQLTSFDKHQFPITILNCSALYSYSRFKKLPQNFFLEPFQGLRKNVRSICQPVLWGLRCLLNFSFIWFQGLTVKKLKVAGSVAKVSI